VEAGCCSRQGKFFAELLNGICVVFKQIEQENMRAPWQQAQVIERLLLRLAWCRWRPDAAAGRVRCMLLHRCVNCVLQTVTCVVLCHGTGNSRHDAP
jgi:hypothetical protein